MVGDTYQQAIDTTTTYSQAMSAGTTYRDILEEVLTSESLVLGDSDGNVYQYSPALTTDDGNDVPAFFTSKVFDYGQPDVYKAWEGLVISARGTKLVFGYRVSDFDKDDEGWVDFDPVDLTDEYAIQSFFFDGISSLQIQFRFSNHEGSSFAIREFKILRPIIMSEI